MQKRNKDSELLNQNILQNQDILSIPMWILDLERKEIIWANDLALKLFEVEEIKEVLEKKFTDSLFIERITEEKYLKRLQEGEKIIDICHFCYKEQPKLLKCLVSALVPSSEKTLILLEALEELDRECNTFGKTNTLISLYTEEGYLLMQNDAAINCYGDEKEKSLCSKFTDSTQVNQVLKQLHNSQFYLGELQVKTKNGLKWHFIEARLTNNGFKENNIIIISEQNITERKELENSIIESEKLYRLLTENLSDIISRHNPEGMYLYVSPVCSQILGYEPEELIGSSAYEYFHTEDLAIIRKSHLFLLEVDSYKTIRYRMRKKDGEYIWLETTSKSIRDSDTGKVEEIIAISRDITERQRQESLLASQKKILEMIAKNEPLPEILKVLILSIEEQCPEMLGSIMRFQNGCLYFLAAPSIPLNYIKAVDGVNIGPDVGSCGRAVYHKIPVITTNIAEDACWKNFFELAESNGLRACWSLPIISTKGQVFGTFAMYFNQIKKPNEKDLELIETAIHLAAIAIERKESETALQQAEFKYRSIFENINQGIFQTTKDGKYINANPALAKIYGYDSAEDLKENLVDIGEQLYVDANTRNLLLKLLEEHSQINNFEAQVYRKDKSIIWISENTRAVRDRQGNFLYYEGTVEDITARRLAEEKLRHQAYYDSLTKLPNRAWFINELESYIQNKICYSVLFIDLDGFKFVNDSFGHSVGDDLIKNVAHRLQISLSTTNKIARFGGDEFSILIKADVEEAINIAKHIKEQFKYPFQLNDREIFTNFSMGITSWHHNYQKPEEILRDVDLAMYCAKAAGKGCFVVFEPKMQEAAMIRINLENDLRRAIELQELSLRYQPIISLATGNLVGFEALLRWHHSTRGWISPSDFIPVAEETGLINEIGFWVLQEACRQLHEWQTQYPAINCFTLNVNISPCQFQQIDIVEKIHQILQKYQIAGFCLKLEITESDFLETILSEPNTVKKLKALGIGLCIDDFGTGYSSLSRLHEFPIDTLKIDRSFVQTLDVNSGQSEVVRAIINLAHSLDMNVVAEGIETEFQKEKLQQLGCEFGQGFLFYRPLDKQTATNLILEHSIKIS